MDNQPKKGSIWTVPELGNAAVCLVLSGPREIRAGKIEYRVLPLEHSTRAAAANEIVIEPAQSANHRRYVGGVYNLRSVPLASLGRCDDLLGDLAIIDSIRAEYKQFLKTPRNSRAVERADDNALAEVRKWSPVTGSLFVDDSEDTSSCHWDLSFLAALEDDWYQIGLLYEEELLGNIRIVMSGPCAAHVDVRGVVINSPRQLVTRLGPYPRAESITCEYSTALDVTRNIIGSGTLPSTWPRDPNRTRSVQSSPSCIR